MTTPDFPDWAKPVAQRESATILYNADIRVNIDAPTIDTSSYQSMSLSFASPTTGGAAGDQYFMELDWVTNGALTNTDGVSRHDSASYINNSAGAIFLDVPVRGASCQFQVFGVAGQACRVKIVGSTRPVQGQALTFRGNTGMPYRSRLDTGAVVIPAGNTSPRVYLPPVLSKLALQSDSALAAVHYQVDAVSAAGGFTTAAAPLATLNGDGVGIMRSVIDVPKLATELTIVNTSAGPVTVRVRAWDAS